MHFRNVNAIKYTYIRDDSSQYGNEYDGWDLELVASKNGRFQLKISLSNKSNATDYNVCAGELKAFFNT